MILGLEFPEEASVGKWNFGIPDVVKQGDGSYGVIYSADRYRSFTYLRIEPNGAVVYEGRHDNRDAVLVTLDPTCPGMVMVYEPTGCVFGFDDDDPPDELDEKGPKSIYKGNGQKTEYCYDTPDGLRAR
jgi:hypothetical protein